VLDIGDPFCFFTYMKTLASLLIAILLCGCVPENPTLHRVHVGDHVIARYVGWTRLGSPIEMKVVAVDADNYYFKGEDAKGGVRWYSRWDYAVSVITP
jgi:hypothetical protein